MTPRDLPLLWAPSAPTSATANHAFTGACGIFPCQAAALHWHLVCARCGAVADVSCPACRATPLAEVNRRHDAFVASIHLWQRRN